MGSVKGKEKQGTEMHENSGEGYINDFLLNCKKAALGCIRDLERVVPRRDVGYIMDASPVLMGIKNFKEKRLYNRIFVRAPVYIRTETSFYMDYSVDLSEGGVGIESLEPLPKGQQVDLTLSFSSDKSINTQAEVAWSIKGEGSLKSVGLSFKSLDKDSRKQILNIVNLPRNKLPSDS